MAKKICFMGLTALVFLAFFTGFGATQDLADIVKETEAKYAKMQNEVKDMVMEQDMKIFISGQNMTQAVKIFTKAKKFRMESNINMKDAQMPGPIETVTVYDGKDMWMVSPFAGKQKIPNNEGKQYQIERNWWGYLNDKAVLTGSETINGKECYVIKAEKGSGAPFDMMWLDKNTLNPVKVEFKGSKSEKMYLIYSDFRKIKGDWELPYKTEIFSDGKLFSTSDMKSVDINKGLSDDLFDINKVEAKGMNLEEMVKNMGAK